VKRFALCADDFGSGPAADAGILELAAAGRITAVSCEVEGRAFRADLPALLALGGAVDLGLHLDLAPGRAGLLALLVRTHARAIRRGDLARAVARQLDAFEAAVGRAPDFVDGHQHVHQLPVVRDVLLEALAARYGRPGPAVRSTVALRPRVPKERLLAALGGAALRRELRARGVPHNRDFAGVYGLDPRAGYPALFRGWLEAAADGALFLCHPGRAPGDPGDPIAPARAAELAYLASPAFDEDRAAASATLARFTAVAR
jgi:chitin disaccharide deacetylase